MRKQGAQSDSPQDDEKNCSIVDASLRLGLDSFTVCALVQRNKLRAKRLPSGEFVIPVNELQKVFRAPASRSPSERKARPAC
jgi:hypothetical protein